LGLGGIAHPEQLEISIGEEEPAIGRALTGVSIWGTFEETALGERCRLRGPDSATNENVVEFGIHSVVGIAAW
jgi:hypothetical protein